ncbi:uncharacterized protein LOC133832306 [Humulus lupulus]|uniref:uncharacterized protein LOC133832306 n=1 Tax=Humulus lupulus TaxID=3486 RepID=UPI002B4135BF|nr:uncharacterized protein LOC133832306 [Humulus lupulus]
MSNEMYNTIARVTDGIYEGIAIGGDVFLGSTLSDHVLRFNNIPQHPKALSSLCYEIDVSPRHSIDSSLKLFSWDTITHSHLSTSPHQSPNSLGFRYLDVIKSNVICGSSDGNDNDDKAQEDQYGDIGVVLKMNLKRVMANDFLFLVCMGKWLKMNLKSQFVGDFVD